MHKFSEETENLYDMRNNITDSSTPADFIVLNQTQYELGVGIEFCVDQLNYAMDVGIIALTFPL
jgi:hypothetical protein